MVAAGSRAGGAGAHGVVVQADVWPHIIAPSPLRGEGWGEGDDDFSPPLPVPLPPGEREIRLTPSPLRGEGWGEGDDDFFPPLPGPLPPGERGMRPYVLRHFLSHEGRGE